MAEIVTAAGECEAGTLHLWPEVGLVEVIDDANQTKDTEPSELVATGLLNADMPLIRYRVGDRLTTTSSDEHCECGRSLPIIRTILGRIEDVLYTRDGRQVFQAGGFLDLAEALTGIAPAVIESQLVQETVDQIRIRYVPAADFRKDHAKALVAAVRALIGDKRLIVMLEETERIERHGGKMRAVICKVDPSDAKPQRR
jgi:phenylacetate-CoA ligase